MTDSMLLFIVCVWLYMAFLGFVIGKDKSCGKAGGAILCFFLGLIGLLIVIILPDNNLNKQTHDECVKEQKHQQISSVDELTKWNDLRKEGIITEEEFQQKKNEFFPISRTY